MNLSGIQPKQQYYIDAWGPLSLGGFSFTVDDTTTVSDLRKKICDFAQIAATEKTRSLNMRNELKNLSADKIKLKWQWQVNKYISLHDDNQTIQQVVQKIRFCSGTLDIRFSTKTVGLD